MASSFEEDKATRNADQLAHDAQTARALAAEQADHFEAAERDEEGPEIVPGTARGPAFQSVEDTVSRDESKKEDLEDRKPIR